MHIKQNNTDRADMDRKAPHHVAVIFAKGDNAAKPCQGNKQDELGIFPKNIIEIARQYGVRYLTFCCLGNLDAKDQSELGSEFKILFHLLLMEKDWLLKNGVGVRFIEEDKGPNKLANSELNVSVISQIDGRAAIVGAVRALVENVEQEKITSNDITSNMLGEQIAPHGLPDPDLLIFTGGQKRLENGLIWQSAYSEFAFIEQHWENMTGEHFQHILENYMARDRRFGGLSKQVHSKAKAV